MPLSIGGRKEKKLGKKIADALGKKLADALEKEIVDALAICGFIVDALAICSDFESVLRHLILTRVVTLVLKSGRS